MFNFFKLNFLNDENNQRINYAIFFDLLVISLLTFLAFAIILPNGFVIDDTSFILRWDQMHNLSNLPALLKGALPEEHQGVYRPLRSVFYAFSYQLWGENAFGYHLQSILIHLTSTIFVYLIARLISGKKSIAFISAILFGLHPLHTESVAYITASFDNIGSLFFFVAFYCYLKSQNSFANIRWIVSSVIFAILAYLTYEITLVLPILILLYDLIFKKFKKTDIANKFSIYFLYVAPILLYTFIRVVILHITFRGQYLANSFYLTMLTMSKVLIKWLILLIWPTHLSINPEISGGIESWINSYSDLTVIRNQSIFNLDIILSILVILVLVLVAFLTIKKYKIISFSIFWVFICLLPVSNILPQGFLIAERNGYIASFGFVLLAAYLFNLIYQKKFRLQNLLISFLIIISAAFFTLSIIRNRDWFDELSIWQSLTYQKTGSTKAYLYVGNFLTNKGDYEGAITAYQQVLQRQPDNIDVMYSLSLSYALNNQYDLAKSQYSQAVESKPNYTTAIKQLTKRHSFRASYSR